MATKAELEEELERLREDNAELTQKLEDAQAAEGGDGGAHSILEDARAAGYRQGYAAAAAEAADILHQASGKNSPTVKRLRALGQR